MGWSNPILNPTLAFIRATLEFRIQFWVECGKNISYQGLKHLDSKTLIRKFKGGHRLKTLPYFGCIQVLPQNGRTKSKNYRKAANHPQILVSTIQNKGNERKFPDISDSSRMPGVKFSDVKFSCKKYWFINVSQAFINIYWNTSQFAIVCLLIS